MIFSCNSMFTLLGFRQTTAKCLVRGCVYFVFLAPFYDQGKAALGIVSFLLQLFFGACRHLLRRWPIIGTGTLKSGTHRECYSKGEATLAQQHRTPHTTPNHSTHHLGGQQWHIMATPFRTKDNRSDVSALFVSFCNRSQIVLTSR